MYVPNQSAENKNTKVHKEPNATPQQRAPFIVSKTAHISPRDLVSEMRGSNSTERELVMAEGKKITDNAMPVKIPKCPNASSA